MSIEAQRAWDEVAEKGYSDNVYSITSFPKKRQRMLEEINDGDRVLIAGL
jgi:hypothetical protein